MVELKHRYGDYPNGNGPAEAVALAIKNHIGERTRVFRNAERLATVIALMGIDLSEQAAAYGRLLRTAFGQVGWKPEHDWEGPHDYGGEAPSLDEMPMAAWAWSAANAVGVMQDAVSASVARKAETINVLRLTAGVAPLEVGTKPGSKVASASVAGKMLRDFPHLMDERDGERNGAVEEIGSIPAGRDIRPYWRCPRCGNRWRT